MTFSGNVANGPRRKESEFSLLYSLPFLPFLPPESEMEGGSDIRNVPGSDRTDLKLLQQGKCAILSLWGWGGGQVRALIRSSCGER